MFEFEKDHSDHTVKEVPSAKIGSITDDGEVEDGDLKWVEFCTDCKEVVE